MPFLYFTSAWLSNFKAAEYCVTDVKGKAGLIEGEDSVKLLTFCITIFFKYKVGKLTTAT